MNNQSEANYTFNLETSIFDNISFNIYTDKLSLGFTLPMAVLGVLFNLISFGVFCKKKFNQVSLFKYMQAYTLSSSIGSFSLVFIFFNSPYTFPELLMYFGSRVYNCKVMFCILNIYIFSNVLDIFINIERAVCFSTGYKAYKKISPYTFCWVALFACLLSNVPIYFIYHILSDSELNDRVIDANLTNRYYNVCELSQFTLSEFGRILLIVTFIVTGPVVFLLGIATNIFAFISYRRYMERKKATLRIPQPKPNHKTDDQLKKEKKKEDNKISLLFMTVYLSMFSCVNHIIQFAAETVIFVAAPAPKIAAWFIFVGFFSIVLKNVLNIAFFSYFNTRFRETIFFWRKKKRML